MCVCLRAQSQSCPTLCNPMDCSLPGPSVHGILQARILEWVAMPSSRGSSQPRDGLLLILLSSCASFALIFIQSFAPLSGELALGLDNFEKQSELKNKFNDMFL